MSESIINCGPWLVMDKKQSGYIYTDTHTSGRKPPPDFVFDLTFARVNQNQSFLVLAFAWLPPIDCTIFRIVALFGQATGGYLAAPISCPSCAHGLHAKCEIRNCEMMCDTRPGPYTSHTSPTSARNPSGSRPGNIYSENIIRAYGLEDVIHNWFDRLPFHSISGKYSKDCAARKFD